MENEYPKLVRDRIPEIIKIRTGTEPEQRILNDNEEFLDYLLKKVVEEATELQHSGEQNNLEEELADLLELIDTILLLKKKTMEEVTAIQKEKREKRGGFGKRILMLKKVEQPEA
jgi:predicted house-cleaning noncanonical NTP pyrophosphatase (MazG superfamily)